MAHTNPVTLHSLSFSWPDGSEVLSGLEGVFPSGVSGLIGANGSGKSTLLKLIAGKLKPTAGSISIAGSVGYLPQDVTVDRTASVADLLGVGAAHRALKAVEAGSVNPADFDAIGDDWDLQARVDALLQPLGLGHLSLDRPALQLSGGETMLLAVIGQRLAGNELTLLDEPTNNLDESTRHRLYTLIDSWPGTLIIVSHDQVLLERLEHLVELYEGRLRLFGGGFSLYRRQLSDEQQAAEQAAKSASAALKVEKRQREQAETKLARTQRKGRTEQLRGGMPRIVANELRKKAEGNAGKTRAHHQAKVQAAQDSKDLAESRIRKVEHINLELVDPQLPEGRKILEISDSRATHILQGPERVGLTGDNGSGKSTLLHHLLTGSPAPQGISGRIYTDAAGFLPQRLTGLDHGQSPMQNLQLLEPEVTPQHIRNVLARLLLRTHSVDRPLSTLSGGEAFRVYLASLLIAQPARELLILDEPTNNLDIDSTRQLAEALSFYRGALLVVSHDPVFLDQLGLDYTLHLSAERLLHKVYPEAP